MIEKAAIDFFGILGDMSPKEHRTIQRDADHQHYTEGEGRKQIHQEEVQQFVKWLEENDINQGDSSYILIRKTMLQQAGEK